MAAFVLVLLISMSYGASTWASMKARQLPARLAVAALVPAIVSFVIALWIGVDTQSAVDPAALAAHPHEHPARTAFGIALPAAGLGILITLVTHFVRGPDNKTTS